MIWTVEGVQETGLYYVLKSRRKVLQIMYQQWQEKLGKYISLLKVPEINNQNATNIDVFLQLSLQYT
jgi:hypothetical protein